MTPKGKKNGLSKVKQIAVRIKIINMWTCKQTSREHVISTKADLKAWVHHHEKITLLGRLFQTAQEDMKKLMNF